MPIPPHRAALTLAAALSAAGLALLCIAPVASADETEPQLAVQDLAPVDGVKPGSTFDQPVVLTNKGTSTADKVWVMYSVTRGLGYADVPSNCRTHQVTSYDEMTAKSNVVCEFDQAVEPGATFTPEKPLAIKALDNALNDVLRVSVWPYAPGLDDAATPPVAGTAPAVKLVESPAGGEAKEEAVDVPVTSVNTADFKVEGAALAGSPGDTVTLTTRFTNAGPAWVLTEEGGPLPKVLITLPAGTSVVKADGYCEPAGKVYECGTSQRWVDEGKGETYTFKLKIDKRVEGAKGSVALNAEARPFDPDKGNDKADITLDVKSGGSTGSTGSTDGSTGSTGSTGGNEPTTHGSELAATGASSTTAVAGTAAAAAIAGGGALLFVRRRRTQGAA
ncbi:LPXTG cell wall anchor domain-containing protein [Streptomyces sp. NPDC057287]|uniref:LPXTG cell wall anchor domain-containing protein n=1 Tax=Streptomyces sp. NPDC057287 TaxID=3346086 RepID=UPI003629A553